MQCKYIIKTKTDITQSMLDVCVQSSISNLRTSQDGLLAVLKWSGSDPSMFSSDTKYTHSQILTELSGTNWTTPDIT